MREVTKVDPERYLLGTSATIRDVLEKINLLSGSPCLIVDDQRKCVGVVSDGDARRILLQGNDTATPVATFLKSFHSVSESESEESVRALMASRSINLLPIMAGDGVLTGLWVTQTIHSVASQSVPVLVLAGGKGTRLHPLTASVPKPLVEVGGMTLLDRTIEKCRRDGFSHFFVSVNYLGDQVVSHLSRNTWPDCTIEFVHEDSPLGTAGPVGLLPEETSGHLLVVNADVLHNVDLGQMLESHLATGADMTTAVRLHETTIPFGVVEVDGSRVVKISEKPTLSVPVNAGIYILNQKVREMVPAGQPLDMPDLMTSAISAGHTVAAFLAHEYWLDVGTHESLALAETQRDQWTLEPD